MTFSRFAAILLILFCSGSLFAQYAKREQVRSFSHFLEDAARADDFYLSGDFAFSDFNSVNIINLGASGGYPITRRFEVAGSWQFVNIDVEGFDGSSGLSDISAFAKYFVPAGRNLFATGGFLTLPVGSESVGGGNFNLGFFGSGRFPIAPNMAITGNATLGFYERGNSRDSSLGLSGGLIFAANSRTHILGELNFESEGSFAQLLGGVDHQLTPTGHLRGALGLGLDDGAAAIALILSFLNYF